MREVVKPLVPASGSAAAGAPAPVLGSPDLPGSGHGAMEAEVVELQPSEAARAAAGPAGLYITTDPPGAKVYLGGVPVGVTSPAFQKADLTPGTRLRVTLRMKDHRDKVFDVDLAPGIARYEGVKLTPDFGTLAIDSSPAGARVRVGTEDRGTTPAEIRLAPGRHEVDLELEGYVTRSFAVTVTRGGRVEIGPEQARLAPRAFSVNVFADPPDAGARIYLDGEDTGRTAPATLSGLAEGEHTVEVRSAGRSGKAEVTGRHGDSGSVTVALAGPGPAGGPVRSWTEPVTGMEFVWVPAGCYAMGCGSWAGSCDGDEKVVHEVCVDGFWLGRTEVTQGQWTKVMRVNPSDFEGCGESCPVERVSWDDAQDFARRLSAEDGGRHDFRLPSEAEWEYACRSAGNSERYAGGRDVGGVAWFMGNSDGKTHPVAGKAPNGLGLHDMSGNVAEWCADAYDKKAYGKLARQNPVAAGGGARVVRGGSANVYGRHVRCTDRDGQKHGLRDRYLGFRLVRSGAED